MSVCFLTRATCKNVRQNLISRATAYSAVHQRLFCNCSLKSWSVVTDSGLGPFSSSRPVACLVHVKGWPTWGYISEALHRETRAIARENACNSRMSVCFLTRARCGTTCKKVWHKSYTSGHCLRYMSEALRKMVKWSLKRRKKLGDPSLWYALRWRLRLWTVCGARRSVHGHGCLACAASLSRTTRTGSPCGAIIRWAWLWWMWITSYRSSKSGVYKLTNRTLQAMGNM